MTSCPGDKVSRRAFLGLAGSDDPSGTVRSTVHIVGFLVHARPDALKPAMDHVNRYPGAEVRMAAVPGKFAAVIECAHENEITDCMQALQSIPGVIAVSMTAHHFEDRTALSQEMPDARHPA